ncbi:hypothetical protein [Gilvimarinus xylanilyticus]|uniref:Uncharacterized protein n=1 Tax=Gilvimarinus xylanilyticus TaxID=2944139 RepID=A0A9X2HY85_9GAMM|nr:hypothetical protein [Gilvimarinus xylanilyticus]MCP8899914.1 hypothetical protein [Gilvimarinus xylanilyticus]
MSKEDNIYRWLFDLAKHLVGQTPGRSWAAIFTSLLGQACLMVAMLLPIKVVMLLGLDAIPSYMPEPLRSMTLEQLTLLLSGLTLVFYGVYLAGEKLTGRWIDSAATEVIGKTGKVVLFENQGDIASDTYKRMVRAVAALLLTLGVISLLGVLYLNMCLALIAFFALSIWPAVRIFHYAQRINKPQLIIQSLNNLGNIGFLVCFAVVVVDHLYFSAPSVLFTIAALILARQATSKIAAGVGDLTHISRQREKVSALLYQEHLLLQSKGNQSDKIAPLLAPPARDRWLTQVLRQCEWLTSEQENIKVHWLQSTTPDVYIFGVVQVATGRSCLVKIFDTTRKALALHEASLLSSPCAEQLPAPKLEHASILDGFHIHVLATPPGGSPLDDRGQTEALSACALRALCYCPPGGEIQDAYLRSHPLLWQKLFGDLFQPLYLAADEEQTTHLNDICQHLEPIREKLRELPLTFVNPAINYRTLIAHDQNRAQVSQWGQWKIECFGAQFPANAQGIASIADIIDQAQGQRSDIAQIDSSLVKLACWLSGIEQAINSQRYLDALDLLPACINCLRAVKILPPPKPKQAP